ncbi:MAG: hypothetical protein ACKJSG_05810 [Lentisphaeria bacterium]
MPPPRCEGRRVSLPGEAFANPMKIILGQFTLTFPIVISVSDTVGDEREREHGVPISGFHPLCM